MRDKGNKKYKNMSGDIYGRPLYNLGDTKVWRH